LVGTKTGERYMKQKITYWKESDGKYLGYLHDYPDHWTQGENLEDLKEHLLDLYREFSRADLPGIKKVEEIEVG
jgi:hypothetical protein